MALTEVDAARLNDNVFNTVGPFTNRIINGDMRIDQRNAGASVTPAVGQYTLDRWVLNASAASKVSVQQNAGSVTPPAGFVNYAGLTSTSAYTVASGDYISFSQIIEGFNVADLGWGTANAKSVTISFWVRSSLTGTFGGVVQNGSLNRSYPFNYTISSANTWEQKSVTIPGDTSGTWATGNTAGISLLFGIGVGTTYQGTAGSWASANYSSATGATNIVGTNGATFYITGVQLEAGSVATPFERRSYGQELALCQRYAYALPTPGGLQYFLAPGAFGSATTGFIGFNFPQLMRATPSLSPSPTASNYQVYAPNGGAYQTLTSISLNAVTTSNFALITFGIASGGTAGQVCYLNSTSGNTAPIILSAEL